MSYNGSLLQKECVPLHQKAQVRIQKEKLLQEEMVMSFIPVVRFGAHVGRTLSSLQAQSIQRGYLGRQRDAYKALGDGYKKYLARQGLSVNPARWQAYGYGGKYDQFNSGYQASGWNSASTAFGGLDRGTGMVAWL